MSNQQVNNGRRQFLKTSSAATVGATLAANTVFADNSANPGGSGKIKIGLIGAGGRGTGAAMDALAAGDDIELVAIGDAFRDRAEDSLKSLKNSEFGSRVNVTPDRIFSDFDNYKGVTDNVDVVLLCTPPGFRPIHLKYAVDQGKHVFCEKPVATDAPGVRSVIATSEEAKKKNLSLVSGLCWRYHHAKKATLQQVLDGAIGDILTMQCNYNTGGLWHRGDNPDWSRMEYQMRNWLYYAWLSGDFITEQHIHSLDKMMWAMQDVPPAKATSLGGRQTRTEPKYGHCYDHFATVYEWDNGVRCYSYCRQQNGCSNDVSDWIYGNQGMADVFGHKIVNKGETKWKFRGDGGNMYRLEHQALFNAIRNNEPINNGDYMAKSTLMAILGREAAYTGKTITWNDMLNSDATLVPTEFAWTDMPEPPVAMPGHA